MIRWILADCNALSGITEPDVDLVNEDRIHQHGLLLSNRHRTWVEAPQGLALAGLLQQADKDLGDALANPPWGFAYS
ncbi:hypothetical protein DNTS_003955 [Danionella cerebrum]|uniref:Uncharacterized protein n=1 Tax=Danionella cerebrum TaxID=2873325 RepID=A0A553Q1C9_9TELE|nr:hypothetical protein DNTS_003955 [Danionella translucida]